MSLRGRRRLVVGVVAAFLVLVVAGGLWAWQLYGQLDEFNRFELDRPAAGQGAARPEDAPDKEALTFLLAGVDNGERADLQEMLASGEWRAGTFRSDAILVLHIPADRQVSFLVSIPRDSWVPVDGYGQQKINAAFSYGGPSLLTRTVEQVTDVHVDHVIVADWAGFEGITETLGGVRVDDLEMGPAEALRYVRERKSLERGDFERVERQRKFLLGVLRELHSRSIMINPAKLSHVVDDLSGFVSVDSGMTKRMMVDLSWSTRDIGVRDVKRTTAPHLGIDEVGGQSVVRLDIPATQALFDDIIPTG